MNHYKNLKSERYKTCGYGEPFYDVEGHYDEVACLFDKMMEDKPRGRYNFRFFCGDERCPLDKEKK